MGRAYYRAIEGSRRLRTEPLGLTASLSLAESLAPGDLRRFRHGDDWLGAVVLQDGTVTLPLSAFDRLAGKLSALEQATYLHLLRSSYGEERNFCRLCKRELMERLSLSERKLNRVLDGLVKKGAAAPLHRDNRGTLYRVFLPEELLGEPLRDGVLLGEITDPTVRVPPRSRTQVFHPMAQFARTVAPEIDDGLTIGAIAREFWAARGGIDDGETLARALHRLLLDGIPRWALLDAARFCAQARSAIRKLPLERIVALALGTKG